jgi:hypothetical protein
MGRTRVAQPPHRAERTVDDRGGLCARASLEHLQMVFRVAQAPIEAALVAGVRAHEAPKRKKTPQIR